MKKILGITIVLSLVLVAASAFATSSGTFTFNAFPASCTATPATWTCDATGACYWQYPYTVNGYACGTLSGGISGCAYGPGGTQIDPCCYNTNMSSASSVQVPNNSTALLIRPSLDTGIFTATTISTSNNNATSAAGVTVCVNVYDSNNDPVTVYPTNCIVYDQRIQQIGSQLFSQLSECNTNTTCTGTGQGTCSANYACVNGYCQNQLCNFSLLLTTLSAHSYDFVAKVGQGTYNVVTSWMPTGNPPVQKNNTTGATSQWCVGPAMVTVQQVADPPTWSVPTVYDSIANPVFLTKH